MIKILVVDDEAGVCESIKRTFSYVGFTVFTATSAQKALNILNKQKPKIIFLDLLMPDVNGLDLLQQIKKINENVIVIIVTVKDDEETKKRALQLGADEYITKPFSFDELRTVAVQKIQNLLELRGHMAKPVILVVDDEKTARNNLKDFILPRYECDIEEAGDGQSAIEKVKKLKPDVVFLDIRMPGMSGIDVISEIRQISPDSRMIVISAWGSQDVITKAMQMGAFDYIEKPITLSVLQERLEAVLTSMGKLMKKSLRKR